MKIVTDDKATQKLNAQHLKVQSQIETLPQEQRNRIKGIQKLVDHEINEMNALFFNDGMFAADAFLKRNGLPGSCKEKLVDAINTTKVGSLFVFQNKTFIKSYDGLVHVAQDYIRSLEMTIAEQVEFKEVKYITRINELDTLSFIVLIKQAFKNLIKGKNNG